MAAATTTTAVVPQSAIPMQLYLVTKHGHLLKQRVLVVR
jgi:hypothetical protein